MGLLFRYILIHVGFLLLGFMGFSQTLKDDLMELNKKLMNAKSYEVLMSVKLYKTQSDTKPMYIYNGRSLRNGDNYLATILDKTTIINEDCELVVDSKSRTIIYRLSQGKKQQPENGVESHVNLDSLLETGLKNVKYLVNNAVEKVIEINMGQEYLTKVLYTLDSKTKLIKQITYLYNPLESENAKVEIQYTKMDLSPKFTSSTFSQSPYILIKGKKATAIGSYKNYHLIDQSHSTTK